MNALGSQHLIASAVQRALHGKDHRFKTYAVREHELVLHLDRVELTPKSLHVARRIEETIRTMPDAQLGRHISDAGYLLSRLLTQHTDTASAPLPLLSLALSCLQSGMAGLIRRVMKTAYPKESSPICSCAFRRCSFNPRPTRRQAESHARNSDGASGSMFQSTAHPKAGRIAELARVK